MPALSGLRPTWTLRTRLTSLLLSVLGLALLLTGGLLVWGVRHLAQQTAERSTWHTLGTIIQGGQELEEADERHGFWYAQLSETALRSASRGVLLTPDGQQFTSDNRALSLSKEALNTAQKDGQGQTGPYLLLRAKDGSLLGLSVPEQETAQLVRQVTGLFGLFALLTLLLAAVLARQLVWAGLKPLRQMAQEAEAVDEHRMQPLPVPLPPDEVRSLAESLNRMLLRLQDALRHLRAEEARTRAFAADASHELRTPLAAIQGSLEVLERTSDDPDSSSRLIANLRRETRRAARLVADLLTLTRLDAGESLHLEPVELEPLLRSIVELAQELAPELRFELKVSPTSALVDKSRLESAVWNLLRNAIHACVPGDTITVNLCEEADQLALSVLNLGEIPPELLPRLFERFARGPDPARDGAGLGLAIVQAIARAHGGEVWARSEGGQVEVGLRWQRIADGSAT